MEKQRKTIFILAGLLGLVFLAGAIFILNNYRLEKKTVNVPVEIIEEEVACGVENCHGLEVLCGENPARICTMEYRVGDICRQFAGCEVVEGGCQQKKDQRFDLCADCVLQCENDFAEIPDRVLECEALCAELE